MTNTLRITKYQNGTLNTYLRPFNAGTLNFLYKQFDEISEELRDPKNLNAASQVIAEDIRDRAIDIASRHGVYKRSKDGQKIDSITVTKTASGRSTVSINSGVRKPRSESGRTDWGDAYYIEYGYGPLGVGHDVPGKPSGYVVNETGHTDPWRYRDRHTNRAGKSFGMAAIAPGYKSVKGMRSALHDPRSKLREKIVDTVLGNGGE